ncbi:MAG: class I SAM-dependent methyltransferase [Pseudomonadota bacterium]
MTDRKFVPALGSAALTGQYDRVIALMTREKRWRAALLSAIDPKNGEVILDVGAGTGTQAIITKRTAPGARVIALDPDPEVLRFAKAKAEAAGVVLEYVEGMGDRAAQLVGVAGADKVISSLMLHHCSIPMKSAVLAAMHASLRPQGILHIADYGQQRTFLMRLLFLQVQLTDGFETTQPNADGMLPQLIAQAGFVDILETRVIQTLTGSISIYTAVKPAQGYSGQRSVSAVQ